MLKKLLPLILMVSCSVAAASKEINEAVKQYYAGNPEEAIEMLKPLAYADNVEAQYLLGNIFYTLSQSGKYDFIDEAVSWYEMAAKQNIAAANYALGAIFQNKWLKSRSREDAANAIVNYQKAVDLGDNKARSYLTKMKYRSGLSQPEAAAIVKERSAAAIAVIEPNEKAIEIETESMETGVALLSVDDSTSAGAAKESETASETEPVSISETPSPAITEEADVGVRITIALGEISSQCQNLTEAGFALYAEAINGALLSGQALVVAMRSDSSEPGTFSIELSGQQPDGTIFLNLRKVPAEVARTFEKGREFEITGIIVDSRLVGANCSIDLNYQPATG